MAQAVIDSQVKPNLSPPQKCPNGCARWKNLAEDGNTQNQYQAEAVWLDGVIPDSAGNQCAQPIGFPGEGPWCYCKETNDGSWGYCEEKPASADAIAAAPSAPPPKPSRNAEAAICRSVPNGLNDLNSKIDDCTTSTELNRNTNFAANTFKLQKDIQTLTATAGDSLIMGDTMFGQYGYQDVAVEVKERSSELKGKKEKLLKEVDSNEAIIERSNRDFSDVKDTITEPQPKKVLRFIEDYTLAFLSIAYLFMIIAVMYVYISTSELKLVAFGKSFVCSILLTIFLFMLLYYLT